MKNDFKSILAIEFRDYLRLLLSAGRSTHNHEVMLRNLDSFLLQSNISTRCLDENTVNQWLSTICGTSANKVSYIARYRGLSKYLRSVGVAAFEPEYPSCSHTYTPYIFSDEEWKRMISSADDLPYSDNNPESAVLFCILLRILYGCGLRRNEALELETRDIDLNSGVLFVRHAKNDKQRYVPMDESLTELLRWYLSVIPHRKYLFVNKISGKRFSAEWARKRIKHLLQDCDIVFERTRKNERGPCLHCFRHTFVANSFNQLLQTSLDFDDAVPFISTYLGHCDLRETGKYLQANYDFFQHDQTLITDYARKNCIFPEVIDE